MLNVFKKMTGWILVLTASGQAFAVPFPEIDGSLGLQVLALGAGLAFLVKRNKK